MQALLSEQEVVRREKLAGLMEMGIDPYPAPLYEITHTSQEIKNGYNEETKEAYGHVSLAGRIMSVRDMGKANFAVLQDGGGRLQLYVKRDEICPGEDKSKFDIVWKKLLDQDRRAIPACGGLYPAQQSAQAAARGAGKGRRGV